MGKKLFVGNLAYSITETDLRDVFAEAGDVTEVKVVLDRETGRPRGFAFVEMANEAAATAAMANLDGREIQGRAMNVKEAQERSAGGRDGAGWSRTGGQRRW